MTGPIGPRPLLLLFRVSRVAAVALMPCFAVFLLLCLQFEADPAVFPVLLTSPYFPHLGFSLTSLSPCLTSLYFRFIVLGRPVRAQWMAGEPSHGLASTLRLYLQMADHVFLYVAQSQQTIADFMEELERFLEERTGLLRSRPFVSLALPLSLLTRFLHLIVIHLYRIT